MARDIEICFTVWDLQKEGYVFLCKKQDKTWREYCFRYPQGKDEIVEKFQELKETRVDIYWSILTFKEPHRQDKFANGGKILYADLDFVFPEDCVIKPSIAWKSSIERFQAIWVLRRELGADELVKLNRALTYACGADKSGWDLSQVLRVPNTTNYKYSPVQQGRLLWCKPRDTYTKKYIEQLLPGGGNLGGEPGEAGGIGAGHSEFIRLLSLHRKRIPAKVSRTLQYPDERIETGKRSEVLWSIEMELVKAGVPVEDIVVLVSGSAWNKYRGRKDEAKRILTEVQKVYDDYKSGVVEAVEKKELRQKLGEEADNERLPWSNFTELMGSITSKPGWLVEDMWLRGSHGIIAGEPKTFKSTIALDLAVSVSSGKPLWDKYTVHEQGPVLIVQNENADWIMRDRVEKSMASKNLVGNVKYGRTSLSGKREMEITFAPDLPISFLNNYGFSFDDPLHREQLEESIGSMSIPPVLIIFDPLYLMFDGDLNSAKDLNSALGWLMGLRNSYGSAIMLIHHWNKNGQSNRGGQRMLGSTTLHGWTESSMFMKRGRKNGSVILEREYRAASREGKLELLFKMGDFGDPTYSVEISDHRDESEGTDVDEEKVKEEVKAVEKNETDIIGDAAWEFISTGIQEGKNITVALVIRKLRNKFPSLEVRDAIFQDSRYEISDEGKITIIPF